MRKKFLRFLLLRTVGIVMSLLAFEAWADCDLDYKLAREAGNGNLRAVQQFLSEGANINPSCNNVPPPLLAAIYWGKNGMIEFLVRNGAKVDSYDPMHGSWAIISAAENENFPIVQFLIENGANVNRKHKKTGFTALHWAAKKGDEAIAQDLISAGANVNARNRRGETPLDIAQYYRNRSIIELLGPQTRDEQEPSPQNYGAQTEEQENTCSREQVIRLLDAQFTREEINRMCR